MRAAWRHGFKDLTEEQKASVLGAYDDGAKMKTLGARFGISGRNISSIIKEAGLKRKKEKLDAILGSYVRG
jgi:hypothetical protein